MLDAERIPRLDMRLAPECAPDLRQAAVMQLMIQEREARDRSREMREAEMKRLVAMHDAAIQERVDRLKRGELAAEEIDPNHEQVAYARDFMDRAAYGMGASHYPGHHGMAGTICHFNTRHYT